MPPPLLWDVAVKDRQGVPFLKPVQIAQHAHRRVLGPIAENAPVVHVEGGWSSVGSNVIESQFGTPLSTLLGSIPLLRGLSQAITKKSTIAAYSSYSAAGTTASPTSTTCTIPA